MSERICSIEGCSQKHYGRGWCMKHWSRWRKHGDPEANSRPEMSVAERFWAKVDKQADCWVWTAALRQGYGHFRVDNKSVRAHRWAYEALVGPIPGGLQLDHLCRNPLCVNPSHLEPVTQRENILRGEGAAAQAARRTHCPQGHPYDEANTIRSRRGYRTCRTCIREDAQRRRDAAKAIR